MGLVRRWRQIWWLNQWRMMIISFDNTQRCEVGQWWRAMWLHKLSCGPHQLIVGDDADLSRGGVVWLNQVVKVLCCYARVNVFGQNIGPTMYNLAPHLRRWNNNWNYSSQWSWMNCGWLRSPSQILALSQVQSLIFTSVLPFNWSILYLSTLVDLSLFSLS